MTATNPFGPFELGGTQVSKQAQGYQDTPGLYTPEQIAGWRKVTDTIHGDGEGHIDYPAAAAARNADREIAP
jgi:2,4-dienoyl-CoA reductase-like NADH-dependent reductase (Old Yellow Enzyme family)